MKQNKKFQLKRTLSVFLSAVLMLSVTNIGPLYAAEEENAFKTIVGFDKLNDKYEIQKLSLGASEEDIIFPTSIWADLTIEKTEADEGYEADVELTDNSNNKPETATPSHAESIEEDEEKTGATQVRKQINEIEWVLNTVESGKQEFNSDVEGTYVYEPLIPLTYYLDASAILPQITVVVENNSQKDGIILTAESGNYLVTVAADADVFPEGVSLSVDMIENEDTAAVLKQAVEELEGEEEIPEEELVYFNVSILDKDGNEIQPDNEKGSVTISFENLTEPLEEAEQDDTRDYQIYHMDEESQTMEKKETTVSNQSAKAEMEHFSPVVIRAGRSRSAVSDTTVTTANELKAALESKTASTISLGADIEIAANVTITLGAEQKLIIPSGKVLTIKGKINTYNGTDKKTYLLTIQGGGSVTIPGNASDSLRGKITLGGAQDDAITVNLESTKACVRASQLNVNKGATIVIDSQQGNGAITINKGSTLNVNDGGLIKIENFQNSAILCSDTTGAESMITINSGGEIAVNTPGTGSDKPAGIKLMSGIYKIYVNGGTLSSTNDGGIYLVKDSKVQGMANLLNDQGKDFATDNIVTVGAADTVADKDQLSEGLYVGNGSKFTKAGNVSTGLTDGILTLSTKSGADDESGWGWNGAVLNLNDKFKGNKQIIFAPGINPKIILNRGLTITPDSGSPAITASGDLTITSTKTDNSGKLTAVGSIDAKSITIDGTAQVTAGNSPSSSALQAKSGVITFKDTVTVTANGSISAKDDVTISGNASVTVNADSSSAALRSTDGTITISDTAAVTATNQSGAAMNTAPDTSSYTGFVTASELAGGTPTVSYNANSISSYKYLKFSTGSNNTTNLTDGILTLSTEPGGDKESGWGWNGAVLNLNDKFKGNKQIVFAPGINPKIILNRGLTITPDSDSPAITASGDLTITSTVDAKLTANGPIEAKNIVINGNIKLDLGINRSIIALHAKNGTVTVGDTVMLTTNGPVAADSDITINGSASIVINADSSNPALHSKNGAIIIRDSATAIASNQGGAAMNPAPNTSGYDNLVITASEHANGGTATNYHEDNINSYRYLKIEKSLTVTEIEDTVSKLDSGSSPELIDTAANQIRNLTSADIQKIKPETIEKVDRLLQEVTGIGPISNIETQEKLTGNKQIQKAEISGSLLAAGITAKSNSNTQLEFKVTQKQPENGAAVTLECDLIVNGNVVTLETPVNVKIALPPEFFPLPGYKIHHVGDGIDEWLDFIYDGSDNSTQFKTNSFSTFSIVRQDSSSKPSGSGSSGGGSGGSSGGGGGRGGVKQSGNTAAENGKWIQDAIGWWYQNANKTYPKDGWFQLEYLGKSEWYYFDKNGYMVTGWINLNGKWYYLNETQNGTKGAKLTNTWVGEYYLNMDGIWEEGKKKPSLFS